MESEEERDEEQEEDVGMGTLSKRTEIYFIQKLTSVSCEYDRVNS